MSAPARSRGLDTAITSVSQLAVLGGAAIMGVLIGARFGATPETDGFFTANALYGVTLFLAQSLRTTAASRLLGDVRPFPRLAEHLDALVVLVLASAALAGAAVLLVGALGLEPAARESFRVAIVLLVPAAAFQLFSGLGSAALATYDDFTTAAVAFGAGAVTNVVGVVFLTLWLGIDGVAVALVGGSLVGALIVARALLQRGWRPRMPRPSLPAAHAAWRLSLGAGAAVASQIVLTVSVTAAATVITGGATIFSYASMVIMALTAAFASPLGVVFAPVVARDWDRQPQTLVPLALRAYRVGALLLAPACATIVLIGPKPAALLLAKVPAHEIEQVFVLVLVLAPSVLATMLGTIPLTGVLAQHRLGTLAAGSLAVAAGHVVACLIVAALGGGLAALAALTTASAIALSFVPVTLAVRQCTPALLRAAGSATLDLVVPSAAAFAAAAVALAAWTSLGRGLVAFGLGSAVTACWIATRHRAEVRLLAAALRPSGP